MPKVDNVTTGKPNIAGAIYNAPTTTNLPVDAKSKLNENFKELGFVSEDGLTNSNSTDGDSVKAWGGSQVLQTQTSKEDTFTFTLIEATNIDVLKTVFGDKNVSGELATGISITVNSKEPEEQAWVIDMILRNNTLKRIVIPLGKISEVGDVVYNDSDPVGYEITLKCSADSKGNMHYEYIQGTEAGA